MNQYEAMFLFDPSFGDSFENCESEIRRLMERAEAELLFCRVWDERRLAYRVKGRKRGVYVLTYFNAPSDKIAGIERDVKLGEDTLRVLILRADGVTPEMMDQVCSARGEERPGGGEMAATEVAVASGSPASSKGAEPAPADQPAAVASAGVEEAKPAGEAVASAPTEPVADDDKVAAPGSVEPE